MLGSNVQPVFQEFCLFWSFLKKVCEIMAEHTLTRIIQYNTFTIKIIVALTSEVFRLHNYEKKNY